MDVTLAKQEFKDFFSDGRQQSFDRNEIIIQAGVPPKSIYWIVEGYVRVVSYSNTGNERNHFFFGPGEVFSTTSLFGKHLSKFEFVATTKIKAKSCSISDYKKFIEQKPHVMMYIINVIITAFDRLYCMQLEHAEDRVGYTLLNLAERFGSKSGDRTFLDISINQQQLADMVRLTRESVGKVLAELESEKAVVVGGKYIMVDTEQLQTRLENI